MDCDILTKKEIGLMMKHYVGVDLEYSLPFMHSPRQSRQRDAGFLHRVYRFEKPCGTSNVSWRYSGKSDTINLTVSKPVMLHGVQHFGSEGGKYTVSLEVKDVANGFSLVKQTGMYSSEKDETNGYYGFDVMFDHSVCLERGKTYETVSLIQGPSSWRVVRGKYTDEVEGIRFSFSKSSTSRNGTDEIRGQFPALLFSTL